MLGAFILGSLIIFGIGIFIVGNRQFIFSRTYRLNAPFDNVAGLDEGAVVRAGGVRIGTVDKIQMPHQAGEKVLVVMKLENSTRDVVKKDSVAAIETEGLLGDKYVSISFGSQESESVREGDAIDGRPPLDYADLARKANELMDTSKVAMDNLGAATTDMKSIAAKVDSGQGTIGALVNDKSLFQNLNATTADAHRTVAEAQVGVTSFSENMEALKHNFFLRGFFNKRGYTDSGDLTRNEIAALPSGPYIRKFTFDGKDLFDKPTTAKLKKAKSLNEIGNFLQQTPYGLAVITASTGAQGDKDKNRTLSQARAMVVRQYLAEKFKTDDTRIKTKGMGEEGKTDPNNTGRVEVIVYPGKSETGKTAVAAKRK